MNRLLGTRLVGSRNYSNFSKRDRNSSRMTKELSRLERLLKEAKEQSEEYVKRIDHLEEKTKHSFPEIKTVPVHYKYRD